MPCDLGGLRGFFFMRSVYGLAASLTYWAICEPVANKTQGFYFM